MKRTTPFPGAVMLMACLAAVAAVMTNGVVAENGMVGGAYGGRYTAYGATLAAEATVTKSYAVAIFAWSYIGLYLGLAVLGVTLTVLYWHIAAGAGASPNQITTIVTATIIAFVLLLLLLAVFTAWSLGVVTP